MKLLIRKIIDQSYKSEKFKKLKLNFFSDSFGLFFLINSYIMLERVILVLKSVIPFTKELDFSTKVSEITSISLEREFEMKEASIDGNLFVTGEYKSHEVSANVIPFSFKIPFTIEIPDNLDSDSVTLEISDFAYDSKEENKIVVNIELELSGEIKEVQEEKEEEQEPVVELDSDEIIRMMEEERETKDIEDCEEEIVEEETEENISEIINNIDIPVQQAEKETEIIEEKTDIKEERVEGEEMILENISQENEYATYHIHIVKNGETVETICTMYNSNLSILSEYNDLSNVQEGEKIIIPENDES